MASIPLPELSLQPPQAPNLLDQYSRLMQIREALQQQQYQQQMQPLQLQQEQQQVAIQAQNLKDVQAGQAAYGEWNDGDYSHLASLIVKHGGSLNAANQVAAYGLNQQKTQSEILKNQGEAGKAQVETRQKNMDIAAGKTQALLDLPDDQLQAGMQQTLQQGLKEGWIDPQHAQQAQQLAQAPPDKIRQALPIIVKSYQAESQQAENALKQAQAAEATATAAYKQAENAAIAKYGGMSDQMLDVKYNALAQQQAAGQALAPDDSAFMQGYEKRKLLTAQFKVENRQGPQGTWQLVEDAQGNPTLLNSVTGETRAAPGIQKAGTYQKTIGAAEAANNYAKAYIASGNYTGPGDEALLEKYFELAKPTSGFRMSQPQMNMLNNAQSWMNSVQAKARHATVGTWFSNSQRQQIVQTMSMLGGAKGVSGNAAPAAGGGGGAPGQLSPAAQALINKYTPQQ